MKAAKQVQTESDVVAQWTPLIHKFLNRSNIKGIDREDQEQMMAEQVVTAWRSFDPEKAQFITYLWRCFQNKTAAMVGEAQKRKDEFTFGEMSMNQRPDDSKHIDMEYRLGSLANNDYQFLSGNSSALDLDTVEEWFYMVSLTVPETKVAILQALGFRMDEINEVVGNKVYQTLKSKTRDLRDNIGRRRGHKISQYQAKAIKLLKNFFETGEGSIEELLAELKIKVPSEMVSQI